MRRPRDSGDSTEQIMVEIIIHNGTKAGQAVSRMLDSVGYLQKAHSGRTPS